MESDSSTSDADIGLRRVDSYSGLHMYVRELWRRRAYVVHVPRNNLRARNTNTILGNLWQLLSPALSVLVYFIIFGLVLRVTRGVEYYIAFLAIGVFAFSFTQRSVTASCSSLTGNAGLMRSIRFPRALLPITTVTTELLAFLPTIAVSLAVTLLNGAPIRLTWLLLIPLVGVQYLVNVGMALVIARLNHIVRDVERILPYIFRLVLYASGVIFSVSAYVEDPTLKWLFYINPIFCLLTLYRWAVLGMPADLIEVWSLALWTAVLLVFGIWWFRRGEPGYGS